MYVWKDVLICRAGPVVILRESIDPSLTSLMSRPPTRSHTFRSNLFYFTLVQFNPTQCPLLLYQQLTIRTAAMCSHGLFTLK